MADRGRRVSQGTSSSSSSSSSVVGVLGVGSSNGGGGGGGSSSSSSGVGGGRTTTGVSLTRPRPEANRIHNEYVDTPFRSRVSELHPAALHSVGRGILLSPQAANDNNNKKSVVGCKVVTSQPEGSSEFSITCSDCGKCRCEACRSPRSPPSAWLCSDFCYCSVDSAVDYASCLCCVKGGIYHCWESQREAADDPCSCGGPSPIARWTCLALAALPLPCLLCYWPFRSLSTSSKKLYALCSRQGCNCPHASLLPPH